MSGCRTPGLLLRGFRSVVEAIVELLHELDFIVRGVPVENDGVVHPVLEQVEAMLIGRLFLDGEIDRIEQRSPTDDAVSLINKQTLNALRYKDKAPTHLVQHAH